MEINTNFNIIEIKICVCCISGLFHPSLTVITSTVESQVNKYTCNFDCGGGKSINNCYSFFTFYFLFTQKCETQFLLEIDGTLVL